MQSFKIFTLGCKVNQYESQFIRETLLASNFREVYREPADIYIINTCTVTQKADRDSRHLIYRAYQQNPSAKILVTGCYTELDADIIGKIRGVSFIVKNKDKFNIVNLLNGKKMDLNISGISEFSNHTRAFLKVQDGCDNFCSYCKIPLVRGSSFSRKPHDIIKEAENLVQNGYKEIVLCGICLGSYGKDLEKKIELIDLLKILDNLEGDFRIRLSSLEAWDITERFLTGLDKFKRLCPHLHIPIQSGSDKILQLMRRRITSQDYLKIIRKLKEIIPSLAITTDIMVGFPQETDEDFKKTVDLLNEIQPLKIHIFSYSPRNFTLAYNLKGRLPPLKIKERIAYLRDISYKFSFTFMQKSLGSLRSVLFESLILPNIWQGFTDNYIKVRVFSKDKLKNRLLPVKLIRIEKDFLWAEL
ncbi:MAG: tRNA (N(6)-L-threonylcarbamoyladenosine(37)-C(2))-methylthiotransferase MtaB [Candidatus Omnitrophica bacterium]|nr:tRNA (N(6)-L-threonylcarbamoyladenosine(37)-C(2))-methylthiotransferase MtaB [Candidatus Omnitrophota bacterium]